MLLSVGSVAYGPFAIKTTESLFRRVQSAWLRLNRSQSDWNVYMFKLAYIDCSRFSRFGVVSSYNPSLKTSYGRTEVLQQRLCTNYLIVSFSAKRRGRVSHIACWDLWSQNNVRVQCLLILLFTQFVWTRSGFYNGFGHYYYRTGMTSTTYPQPEISLSITTQLRQLFNCRVTLCWFDWKFEIFWQILGCSGIWTISVGL